MKKVVAIIPAYNEEKTIGSVVKAAMDNGLMIRIDEVIVVNDGSSDTTAEVAQKMGASIVEIKSNQGKGKALDKGVQSTNADVLLFLDADLIGLKPKHLTMLLESVIQGEADMTVGTIDRKKEVFGMFLNEWFKTESPFSGMRVMRRDFWEQIPVQYKEKFYIESAITYFAKKSKLKIKFFILEGVGHIIKEKKMGAWKGFIARWKMNGQIILVNLALRLEFHKKKDKFKWG